MSAAAGSRPPSSTSTPGALLSERLRVPTPEPSTPDAVIASIGRHGEAPGEGDGRSRRAPVGVGLPGVTIDGVIKTAANIDPGWVDFPMAERLRSALKRPVAIVNDADAAGIAEMRFGVGRGPARAS